MQLHVWWRHNPVAFVARAHAQCNECNYWYDLMHILIASQKIIFSTGFLSVYSKLRVIGNQWDLINNLVHTKIRITWRKMHWFWSIWPENLFGFRGIDCIVDNLLSDLESREKEGSGCVHIFNIDVVDNHEDALIGAILICNLCTKVINSSLTFQAAQSISHFKLPNHGDRNMLWIQIKGICQTNYQ